LEQQDLYFSIAAMRVARPSATSLITLSRIKLDNTLIIYIPGDNGNGAEARWSVRPTRWLMI
jgi:hypothetical protein